MWIAGEHFHSFFVPYHITDINDPSDTLSEKKISGRMSAWNTFRKVWLLPEVYPLIGAMGVATGLAGFAIYNKANDSIVTWNKNKRTNADYFDNIDEYVPVGAVFKSNSSRIFSSENVIYASNNRGIAKAIHQTEPLTFTIRVGDEAEDDEAEDVIVEENVPGSDIQAEANEPDASEEHPVADEPVLPTPDEFALSDTPEEVSSSPVSNEASPTVPDDPAVSVTPVSKAAPPPESSTDESTFTTLSDLKDESLEKAQEMLDSALEVAGTVGTKIEAAVSSDAPDSAQSSSAN